MTDRLDKINELIKQEVGKIILKEVDMPKNILVTITRAKTAPDLKRSTIYVTALPEQKNQEAMRELDINTFDIQKALNRKLHLKQIPKIDFKIDKQAFAEQKIFELLGKNKQEEEID